MIYFCGSSDPGFFYHSLLKWRQFEEVEISFDSPIDISKYKYPNVNDILIIPILHSDSIRWSEVLSPFSLIPEGIRDRLNIGEFKLFLDFSNEAGSIDFVRRLESLLASIGVYNFDNVYFICQNRSLANVVDFQLNIVFYDYFLVDSCFSLKKTISDKQIEKLLNSFNFIEMSKSFLFMNATPRPHRLLAAGLFEHLGFVDDSLVSFPLLDDTKNSDDLSLDYLIRSIENSKLSYIKSSILNFKSKLPLSVDAFTEKGNQLVNKIDLNNYNSTWCSFVTETGVDGSVRRVTEKSFKALSLGHLYISYNHPNSLCILRELGFDLFEDIIPCDYDLIDDSHDRLIRIGEILYKLHHDIQSKNDFFLKEVSISAFRNIIWSRYGFLSFYRKYYLDPLLLKFNYLKRAD